MEKNQKTSKISKTEIIISLCILLFSLEPFSILAFNFGILTYTQNIYNSIHEKYYLTDEEKNERNLFKIRKNMKLLQQSIIGYFWNEKKFIFSIDDVEYTIRYMLVLQYYPHNTAFSKEAILDKTIKDNLYDPYGNKYYYDPDKYEIYCNNADILKIIDSKANKEEYVVDVRNIRIHTDSRFICEKIRDYFNKNKKYPSNIKELDIDMPYEQWGIHYELDLKNYEVVCNNNKRYKF